MKTFTKKLLALFLGILCFTGMAMASDPVAFSITESFDDASHFNTDAKVPDGWLTTTAYNDKPVRYYATDAGILAHSGDYVMISLDNQSTTRDEVIYTPMKKLAGGKEATISFWINAPGGNIPTMFYSYIIVNAGNAQTPEAQTIELGRTNQVYSDWTELKYTFTPEVDGEYCFSITMKEKNESINQPKGLVAIDDVTIEGFEPGEEVVTPPASGESTAFVFSENFDDASHFTASSRIPDGWLATTAYSNMPYRTLGTDVNYAHSGEYIMLSMDNSSTVRDEVIYTPLMKLAGGKEATVSFWIYAPGASNPSMFYSYVIVKAGNAQTAEAQTIELGRTSQAYSDWTEIKYTFTPEADGEYCFSFNMKQAKESISMEQGFIALDDITIEGFEPGEEVVTPPASEPVAFSITENFDDASHFNTDAKVPDGWLTTTAYNDKPVRYYATDAGILAHSGDYVMLSLDNQSTTRDEVIYTPMKKLAGGKEATISFWINAPGGNLPTMFYSYIIVKAGNAQTPEAQTIELGKTDQVYSDWTELKYTFTPEVDGEYCFSITLKEKNESINQPKGLVAIDDVTIEGFEPGEGGGEVVVLPVELTITPESTEEPTIFIGDTYTTTINVKAVNLVGDITVENISTTEIAVSTQTIPMDEAMSEEGYNLTVSVAPTATTSVGGTFELVAENLENATQVALAWKAIEVAAVTLSNDTVNMDKVYIGETYTATVNVKAAKLVEDITIANISTTELTTSVATIPMAEAMSETGYDLVVTLNPTDAAINNGTFELVTANLRDTATFVMNWAAVEPATVTVTPATYQLTDAFVGDTYTTTVNVKATNLVEDIAIANISTTELTTSVDTIPMAEAMSEAGYDLTLTIVPANTDSTTATFDFVTENYLDTVSFEATWAAIEYATITLSSVEDNLESAVLGNTYEVSFNVKATNLVGDITVKNLSTDANNTDATVSTETVPMAEAMSEAGYDITITVVPSVLGKNDVVLELSTENCKEAIYYALNWTATTGIELLEPNQENYSTAKDAPYFNTFDNYENDYDGTTVVPAGWKTVGSYPFFTANINEVDAVTGNFYLVADESTLDNRDDRLYTPFFRLSSEHEYTISYYLYMPGNSGGGVLRATDMKVTVGTEQDIDFHPVTLHTVQGQSVNEWVKQEFTFKPLVSGAYCFAFTLNTEVNYAGQVAIEDFNITAPGLVNRPTAGFAIGGNFNIIDSKLVLFENQMVTMTNLSKDADEYTWEVTYPDGSVEESTIEEPSFNFNTSGDYTIKLTATNSRASLSTSRKVSVEYVNYETEVLSLMTQNPSQDALIERGSIPTFSADGVEDYDYDFVTGYNRYYKKFAERFELPEGTKLNITTLNTWLANYRNRANTSGYESEKPFEIVVYGETEGKLDENKVFARMSTTLKDIFGNSGVSGIGEGRDINFIEYNGKAVEVEGTFYVAFEFAEDMCVTTEDPNVGRSYFAVNAVKHATEKATLYVKPTAVPNNSLVAADGNWYPVDQLDNTKKGIGAYFILWVNNTSGDMAINALGETVFAINLQGDNLIVSGTVADEQVLVYDMSGRIVAGQVGNNGSTTIPVGDLNDGVYVVKTNAGTAKFVK